MKLSILFLFFNAYLLSQNVDMYLSLIHEGQSQGVKENLPELISKYPNDPGVLYLQALLTSNGMKSLEFYSKLIEKFPECSLIILVTIGNPKPVPVFFVVK